MADRRISRPSPYCRTGPSLLSFSAVSNFIYEIDASADLVKWTALTSLSNLNGTAQFTDTDATNFTQRYYRARVLP